MSWTAESRARQSRRIREWEPWLASTGPTTAEGKARSAKNAWRGALREEVRLLRRLIGTLEQEVNATTPGDS